MPYRTLNADRIEATLETLHQRIEERFPNRGLAKLCSQLLDIAREDKRKLAWVAKPNIWLRTGVGIAIALGVIGLIWFAFGLSILGSKSATRSPTSSRASTPP